MGTFAHSSGSPDATERTIGRMHEPREIINPMVSPPPVASPRKRRSARALWRIVFRRMFSYRVQLALRARTGAGKRLSTAVQSVSEILHAPERRNEARRLRYKRNLSGLFKQLMDEQIGAFASFDVAKLRGSYTPWFTVFAAIVNVSVFFFMAAEWNVVVQKDEWFPDKDNLLRYITPTAGVTEFSAPFLYMWGARYLPAIVLDKDYYRWASSTIIHGSIRHCMSNMAMHAFYGILTERVYGFAVVATIWIVSAVGGNLFSALLEGECDVCVGASGAVFGYLGFFIVDTGMRWNRLKRPLLRTIAIFFFVGQFAFSVKNDAGVSHWSHGGGLLCGIACSYALSTDIKNKLVKQGFMVLAAIILLGTFIAIPILIGIKNKQTLEQCYDFNLDT